MAFDIGTPEPGPPSGLLPKKVTVGFKAIIFQPFVAGVFASQSLIYLYCGQVSTYLSQPKKVEVVCLMAMRSESIRLPSDDDINTYSLVSNSHDRSLPIDIRHHRGARGLQHYAFDRAEKEQARPDFPLRP